MSRVCSRPGCAEPAVVTFVFSTSDLKVWVGDLIDDRRSAGHDLCDTHARRFTAPRGWAVVDERSERMTLSDHAPSSPMLARAFRAARAAS